MGKHGLLAVSLIFFALALAVPANAGYWFQSGVRGDGSSAQNSGASVSIQTVSQQQASGGAMAFWVGEDLPNKAFLQVGYIIENQTGNYPSKCNSAGCTGSELLVAGDAEWFYEYFTSADNNSFMGRIGPSGSAGANGSVNNYAFYATGDTWHFLFNGNEVGSVNLGAASTGSNWPVAFAEVANVTNNMVPMKAVTFSNLSTYNNGGFSPI